MTCLLLTGCKEAGQSEWENLCAWVSLIPLSCEGIERPKVVYFKAADQPGMNGYYRGGNLLYISDKLEGKKKSATIFNC